MASAAVATPSAHYLPQSHYSSTSNPASHHPSPSSSAASVSTNMISSEPRKSADDELSGRQSLPSISEVISGTKPGHYPAPPPPPPPPAHALSHGSGLPSPFTSAARSYSETEKHPSPQPLHPASYATRPEPLPAFASSPRPGPFASRSGLPPVHGGRPGSSSRTDGPPHSHELPRPPEPHGLNGAYSHQSAAPLPPPMSYQQNNQLPQGQMPLPGYSMSPRHPQNAHPHPSGHYENRAPPSHPHHDESEYASRSRYESGNRHFENWSYQEGLSKIAADSRTIFNFAEGWARSSRDAQGPPRAPEQLPPEDEVSAMLANAEHLKRSLEQVREMVQISIQNERAREGARARAFEEEQDAQMYQGGSKPQYAMTTEVKKRRGRAAPPGRCHSCNRIDTPEWRRGPDGARTLCNACGLHYAKLERKRQLEARNVRPKLEDRS
jgi:hypothetical protein